ncbi:MAG: acetolactate synthase small subunit [Candidatus Altiarchaeales archaeon]|nr:acetolactate synthase small subunit [Candidatus Altiarchaeales archaeon]
MSKLKEHIFVVLVENRPGVLQRVSSLFSRRRYNIESISVGHTENPAISRMTIVTTGEQKIIEQIEKQLNKLVNVVKVIELSKENSVCRELCIVKVHTQNDKAKEQVIQYADVFRGNVVDVSPKSLAVELTGDSSKIDAFINLVKGFGIKEVARTGVTAVQRG